MIAAIGAEPQATFASPPSPVLGSPTALRVVDVWLIDLAQATNGLEAVLSAAERERAAALRTATLRRRFILRRAARRHILADYLASGPVQIRFTQGPNGKPQAPNAGPLQFNCSHREDVAVVAVCPDAPVGVDVEALDPGVGPKPHELDGLSQVMMSIAERVEFGSLPQARRRTALLTTWTRKEAVVKALGVGLSLPLDSFDVPVDPATPPRLLARRGTANDGKQWSMTELSLPPGYVGTLMSRGPSCRADVRTWESPS